MQNVPSDRTSELDAWLAPGAIVPAYQPVVDLDTGEVRAYEALARWPAHPGTGWMEVAGVARRQGRLIDLDHACRVAALDVAGQVGLGPGVALFVNIEPETLGTPPPAWWERRWERLARRVPLVVELTERSLLRDPASLLRFVDATRDAGLGIALDDVGADPDSLALLDLVGPDVVKLDLGLVQSIPARDQARTIAAVMAYAERTGASVLAEGIETEAHLEQAVALGAALGQGYRFGTPGALPVRPSRAAAPLLHRPLPPRSAPTPVDVARRHRPLRTGPKHLLLAMSRHIEELATGSLDTPMVLTALQDHRRFVAFTARRYVGLARTSPLVAVFGRNVPDHPAPGVRGVDLAPDDPLVREWTVVVLGARTAAALIAVDLDDDGPDAERRFHFLVTHDQDVVTQAARAMISRLPPLRPEDREGPDAPTSGPSWGTV